MTLATSGHPPHRPRRNCRTGRPRRTTCPPPSARSRPPCAPGSRRRAAPVSEVFGVHGGARAGAGRGDRRRQGQRRHASGRSSTTPTSRPAPYRPEDSPRCAGAAAWSCAGTSVATRRSDGIGGIVDYVEPNRFFETYRGPADDFFGSVGSRPEIYPIYWSPPQMQARQSDRMARRPGVPQRAVASESDGVQWFDPARDSLYPDRIRRRPEGADSGGLGTHLDPGTLDLWMTQAYQRAFRHLFDGTVEQYDPWDAAHRTAGPQYPGHDHVLGVPDVPGLDRAVGHGPRPGRAAHGAHPRGHGLPDAAAAAGRRRRRRHVRRHRQPGASPPARPGTRCCSGRSPASPTSGPATRSGGTAT